MPPCKHNPLRIDRSKEDFCHVCHTYVTNDHFREVWDRLDTINNGPIYIDVNTPKVEPQDYRKYCVHLDIYAPISMTNEKGEHCGACSGKWIFPCDVHGKCSVGVERKDVEGVKWCQNCAEREIPTNE